MIKKSFNRKVLDDFKHTNTAAVNRLFFSHNGAYKLLDSSFLLTRIESAFDVMALQLTCGRWLITLTNRKLKLMMSPFQLEVVNKEHLQEAHHHLIFS